MRIITRIYVVVSCLFFALLLAPWIGPVTLQARTFIETKPWMHEVLIGGACLQLCAWFILFFKKGTQKTLDSIVVATIGEDEVCVTRSAITSQASYIVESAGDMSVKSTVLSQNKEGLRLKIRIIPLASLDIVRQSDSLHAKLTSGLKPLCGNAINSIVLEFLEPHVYEDHSDEIAAPIKASGKGANNE